MRNAYSRDQIVPVHRHRAAYAALVLEGGYDEYGPDGRWRCAAGDIVIHPTGHLHGDCFEQTGGLVLDLELPDDLQAVGRCGLYRLPDPDLLLFAASKNEGAEALGALLPQATRVEPVAPSERVAGIARRLIAPEPRSMAEIADEAGCSREHATRSFTAWFGISPGSYRREHRARLALAGIRTGMALADVAAASGYADQAHMTRAFRAIFGATPARLGAKRVTTVQ